MIQVRRATRLSRSRYVDPSRRGRYVVIVPNEHRRPNIDPALKRILEELFKDIRTVGLSIVKTLNRHTRLLERIDRKLGSWGNGRPGDGNARRG